MSPWLTIPQAFWEMHGNIQSDGNPKDLMVVFLSATQQKQFGENGIVQACSSCHA